MHVSEASKVLFAEKKNNFPNTYFWISAKFDTLKKMNKSQHLKDVGKKKIKKTKYKNNRIKYFRGAYAFEHLEVTLGLGEKPHRIIQ